MRGESVLQFPLVRRYFMKVRYALQEGRNRSTTPGASFGLMSSMSNAFAFDYQWTSFRFCQSARWLIAGKSLDIYLFHSQGDEVRS